MDPISTLFLFTLGSAVSVEASASMNPWSTFFAEEEARHQRLGIQIWSAERVAWDQMQEQGLLPPGWNVSENGVLFNWRSRRITEDKINALPAVAPFMRRRQEVLRSLPRWAPTGERVPSWRIGEFTFEGFDRPQYEAFLQRFITDRLKVWAKQAPEILDEHGAIEIMLTNDLMGFRRGLGLSGMRWRELGEEEVVIHLPNAAYHLHAVMPEVEQRHADAIVSYTHSEYSTAEDVETQMISDMKARLPRLLEIARLEQRGR